VKFISLLAIDSADTLMYEVARGKENMFEAFVNKKLRNGVFICQLYFMSLTLLGLRDILQGRILDTEEDNEQNKVPEKRKANYQENIALHHEEEGDEPTKAKRHFQGSIIEDEVMSMLINIYYLVLILCTGPGSSTGLQKEPIPSLGEPEALMLPSQGGTSPDHLERTHPLSRPKVGPVQRREGASSGKVDSIRIPSRSALIGKRTAKKRSESEQQRKER